MDHGVTRRAFLAGSAAAGAGVLLGRRLLGDEPKVAPAPRAQIAITFDLEMAHNFPKWEDMHWDYEKGNLNDDAKRYAVEAARRVKAKGGVIHFFLVGQAMEQENVDWLKEIAQAGHPIGNHTYDHVFVKAGKPEDVQFRFRRAPWLIDGKDPQEVVRENIRMTNAALKTRIGVDARGFRTPGGFVNGLDDAPGVQKMLLDLGFTWVSSRYPVGENPEPDKAPTPEFYDAILKVQEKAQPYRYPSGLIEIPMSPVSDIGGYRGGKWKLEWFLESTRRGVAWAIEHGAVFDFLAHPSVTGVKDPEFKTVDLICDLVAKAGDKAEIVDLDTIAKRVA